MLKLAYTSTQLFGGSALTIALRLRRCAGAATIVAALVASFPVYAQSEISSPNPITTNGKGILGINLVTRGVHHDEIDLISGPQGEASSLSLVRSLGNGMSYGTSMGSLGSYHFFEHQYRAMASVRWDGSLSGQFAVVVLFGKTYTMTSVEGSSTLTNTYLDKDGSIFRDAGYAPSGNRQFEFISHDGARAVFEANTAYLSGRIGEVYAKYIEFPNGEFLAFKYESVTPPIESFRSTQPDLISRLVEIVNSRGYGMRFTYVNPQTFGFRDIRKLTISSVTPFSRTCTYNANCLEVTSQPVLYTYQQQNSQFGRNILHLSTVNRPDGTVSTYTHSIPYDGYITTSTGPGGTPDYAYETGMIDVQAGVGETSIGPVVFKVTDSLGRITRVSPDVQTIAGSVVVEANGAVATHISYYDPTVTIPYNDPIIWQSTDPQGRTTAYTYEISTKIRSIVYPEGNSVVLTRDARGNVVEERLIAKPGSSVPDIVTTSTFTSCDGLNFRYCNKPVYTVDRNGHRTDYQYHPESGLPTLIIYPANTAGVRRAIRYNYASTTPADIYAVPAGVTLPLIWLKSSEEECQTTSISGSVGNYVFSCPAADLITKSYIYEPSTPSAPSRHLLLGQRVTTASGQTLTCFSYDAFGKLTGETAPSAGLAECPAS